MSYSDRVNIEDSVSKFETIAVAITVNIESELYDLFHMGKNVSIAPNRPRVEVTFIALDANGSCRMTVLNGYNASITRDILGKKTPDEARDIYIKLIKNGYLCTKIEDTYRG